MSEENSPSQKSEYTVIVPTLNAEATMGEFFAALKRQSRQPVEILIGDSMSDDKTASICQQYNATIIPIAREKFDHGGTRSLLAAQAKTEIVVFFTQDAILADREAIANLLQPLIDNEKIACSYGRQLPNRNATPIAAHLRLFNYPAKSEIRSYDDRERYGLKTIFISNSFAAYRRNFLTSVGYFKNGLIFGEDTCTLGRLLQHGYSVAYVSEAQVYHSHNYTWLEEFRRSFDIGVLHRSENWLLAVYGSAEDIGTRYVVELFASLWREKRVLTILDAVVRIVAKFVGYRIGRSFQNLPAAMRPWLSMHQGWWRKQEEVQPQ